jgi:hypothetical protein
MTNAPETRKTHITRIVGTNKNGDVLPDIFADVERIDQYASSHISKDGFWQGVKHRLHWFDDQDSEDGDIVHPTRTVTTLKVCSPDEDPNNPSEWIPIPVIDRYQARNSDQGIKGRHDNSENNTARTVVVRRTTHKDTSIDDQASAAFAADPTRTKYVVSSDQYTKDDSTEDTGQYLEIEIIEKHQARANLETGTGQGDDQAQKHKMGNQYLIDASSDSPGTDPTGPGGINPPWRLDPYQNIVNVKFGGGATEFPDPSLVEQNAITIADSNVVSISMAVRLTDADMDKGYNLLILGNNSPGQGEQTGLTLALFKSFDVVVLQVGLGGIYRGVSLPPNVVPIVGTPSPSWTDNATPYTQLGIIESTDISDFVRGNKVFHLALSIDTSEASSATNSGAFFSGIKIECLINRIPVTMSSFVAPVGSFPTDRVWAFAQPDVNGTSPIVVNPSLVDQFGDGTEVWRVVIPAFKMAFNGFTAALPIDSVEVGGLGTVTLDKVQIWTTKYIGMRANIDRFINADGKLQATSVAQQAFGKSEFVLEGGPPSFAKNRGSAGDLTKVGDPVRVKSLTKIG